MLLIALILMLGLSVVSVILVALHGTAFHRTTLLSAWTWALVATSACCASLILESGRMLAARESDIAWYGTAVLGLCPLIAVLGARRPGAGVWNWFVLLPLIAVLLWPVTVGGFRSPLDGLRLQAPPLIGFTLVLCMGCGNYLGTRFWLPAALYWCAEFLLAATVTEWGDGFSGMRVLGAWCWGLAVVLTWLIARRRVAIASRFDRAWFDFRTTYGLVWERRIQQRINERATQEHWGAWLYSGGFEWRPEVDAKERARTAARIDHTLRWLLRRFVEDSWLDARLGPQPSEPPAS